ncbi:MAG: heavy metal transporter [Bacteriovoracaceae bacterium]|nr:heavy metal transporter [Bacteriovoracaceae bacterium]
MKLLKSLFVTFLICLPSLTFAGDLVVTISGMVCAFCAQGIEKKFKTEDSVKEIKVDLDQKKISLKLKDGKQLEDKRIIELVTDSGFNVKKIER